MIFPRLIASAAGLLVGLNSHAASQIVPDPEPTHYEDGRPAARYRLVAADHGIVLRHGDGPDDCDRHGARDVWVWEDGGRYYMTYDGAGPRAWLTCLATSDDLVHWKKHGAVLALGHPGEPDAGSASYGVTYRNGDRWEMFYLGTPNTSPAPELVPAFPYQTMKAHAASPAGPWIKQPGVVPFRSKPGTYYSVTASPGHIVRQDDEFLMFFSASTDQPIWRTIGLACTRDLNGTWTVTEQPLLPPAEQIENTSLYHDAASDTWFLFTNHVGIAQGMEYTDAVWVYWTRDLRRWDPAHKAVVLDRRNCPWSRRIMGLPSVVQVGQRLAIFYDGNAGGELPTGAASHMQRDVGLAWLELPIRLPAQ